MAKLPGYESQAATHGVLKMGLKVKRMRARELNRLLRQSHSDFIGCFSQWLFIQ